MTINYHKNTLIRCAAHLLLFLLCTLAPQSGMAGEIYFYHNDNFGTPMAMTDINGTVVWRSDELPFGEEYETVETPIRNNRRFLGKELDKESGLICMGARFLDPKTGRFTQPDPVGLVDPATGRVNQEMLVNPQRQNRYVYGLNNPYKYLDPDGTDPYENSALRCHVNPHWDSTENMIGGAVIAAGLAGSFAPEVLAAIIKVGKTITSKKNTTVIGRVKDLQNLKRGEQSLLDRLPYRGTPKANWKQNSGVLRQEMAKGKPIRDASPGDNSGQFLNAERNLLRNRGWSFDPKTNHWNPSN